MGLILRASRTYPYKAAPALLAVDAASPKPSNMSSALRISLLHQFTMKLTWLEAAPPALMTEMGPLVALQAQLLGCFPC
jgi:hypothetical protein